ncbi:MAG: hypothetical protein A2W18_15410 [Candidatus Muproteobacteria bacterium RBG_16_60_9]|uniref:DNA binding HTH domain-containing protein n=1 Tax=Candidatus Muproteobacteria bacterium RBG_16_60_9 TaxID=1817755 RepID=A0A1F6V223_9PROT|nr:MAG: hypothetical protein A2W18_15410 [Candidatus Muproteobacteria bacterium RBG_16_60_9]
MTFYIHELPSFFALVFKLVLLFYARKSKVRSSLTRLYLTLLVLMSVLNVIEFVGIWQLTRHGFGASIGGFGFAHFATMIPTVAVLLHISLRLSIDGSGHPHWRRYFLYLYLPVLPLEYLLLLTNDLVAGFAPFMYSIRRDPGTLYYLFETYVTVYLLASLANLIYGARASRQLVISRTRNRLWLLGLSPLALMLLYLMVANYLGLPVFTSTFHLPIAITLFLIATTYAIYQYRLFDIEFYIPWSKVRKRKTAFYQRIQATIAEIAELKSVSEILDLLANSLRCQVAFIGGPRPVIALANGQNSWEKENLLLAEFPQDALKKIDSIVVANEIADRLPVLHGLMKHHKVGAIVPFNSHSSTSAHWMLLGEHFSDQVYTPLDFKMVETLFDRIGERFLDNLLLLRSQLGEANDELRDYQRRLGLAWDELESLRKTLSDTEQDNRALRDEKASLMRQSFRVVPGGLPNAIESGQKTLEQYLAESEREIVRAALRDCGGNKVQAARLLGVQLRTLHYLIQRHNLESDEKI